MSCHMAAAGVTKATDVWRWLLSEQPVDLLPTLDAEEIWAPRGWRKRKGAV